VSNKQNRPQSIINGAPPPLPTSLTRLHVDLEDEEGADLLGCLPRVMRFLAAARAVPSPRILLHCAQGESRSVAVAAAALMAGEGLDGDDALAAVAAASPGADPNPGFRAQLAVWHAMGCAHDASIPEFRAHRAGVAAARVMAGGGARPAEGTLPDAGADGATLYRCRACRRLLASTANAVPVEGAPAGSGFRGKAKLGRPGAAKAAPTPARPHPLGSDGSSLFVEPLAWMRESMDGVSGKLNCPGCAARLGAYDWAGGQTASGAWVTPAFRLHMGRLDAMAAADAGDGGAAARAAAGVGAVRRPRLLAGGGRGAL